MIEGQGRRGTVGAWILAVALVILGTTSCASFGAHKIHQIYYLGIFDPLEQVPPSLYRIRVRGQADFISRTNYAAGWVPAALVDSLGGSIAFDPESKELRFGPPGGDAKVELETGRRMMLFGPEGFREAPAGHRLAIVMASDPSKFFEAIDDVLGQLSAAKALSQSDPRTSKEAVLDRVLAATRERDALERLDLDVEPEDER